MTLIIIVDDRCRSSYKSQASFSDQERAMSEQGAGRREPGPHRRRCRPALPRAGLDGIGVANLMKAAGLTHGGFYGNFESKEDLAVEACERVLARSSRPGRRWPPRPGRAAQGLAGSYLTARHRDRQERMHLRGARLRRRPPGQSGLAPHPRAGLQPLIDTCFRLFPAGRRLHGAKRRSPACRPWWAPSSCSPRRRRRGAVQ